MLYKIHCIKCRIKKKIITKVLKVLEETNLH